MVCRIWIRSVPWSYHFHDLLGILSFLFGLRKNEYLFFKHLEKAYFRDEVESKISVLSFEKTNKQKQKTTTTKKNKQKRQTTKLVSSANIIWCHKSGGYFKSLTFNENKSVSELWRITLYLSWDLVKALKGLLRIISPFHRICSSPFLVLHSYVCLCLYMWMYEYVDVAVLCFSIS